jgi:hypothetical protein
LIGIRMGKYERRSDEMAQLAKHDAVRREQARHAG